jgi:hypothetical protein
MSEDYKYYTPKIEEFHKGFIFEWANPSFSEQNKWQQHELDFMCCYTNDHGIDFVQIGLDIRNEKVRVKHLDRKDFENLGFKAFDELGNNLCTHAEKEYNHPHYMVKYKNGQCILKYLHLTKWLVIGVGEKTGDKQTIFAGHCNNKSELKKLMQQLGINGK